MTTISRRGNSYRIRCSVGYDQKGKQIVKNTTWKIPPGMSDAKAEKEALRRAQIEALAKEFGTSVSQSSLSFSSDKGEEFYQEGVGLVKGEWIETIGEPVFERGFDNNLMYIRCRVKGKAREIKNSKVELEVHVLCNVPDDRYENSEFHNGDNIYLHFEAPVDGYLAVFLYDDINDVVSCLLPYRRDKCGSVAIKADKPYFFFSKEKNVLGLRTEEYSMGSQKELEINTLYMVFSKNEFTKPTLEAEEGRTVLKHLTFEKFNQWVVKLQAQDADAQIEKRVLSIYRD